MWLCLLLFMIDFVQAIYLPIEDQNNTLEDLNFDPGPLKIKLETPSKSTLALTSVLIMGSAGVTVVYVLCIFIVCMRNEETEERNEETITTIQTNRSENSQENEPLMLQFYATS